MSENSRNFAISRIFKGVFLILLLSGCSKPWYEKEKISAWSDGFGYTYAPPTEYCRDVGGHLDFELYCPEGRIEIQFEIPSNKKSLMDHLKDKLGDSASEYQIELIESLMLDNNQQPISEIIRATLQNKSNYLQQPVMIAVLQIDNRYVLITGFAYREDFTDEVIGIINRVMFSLEPFTLPGTKTP